MAPDKAKNILLVDDDRSTRMVMRTILESANEGPFEIFEAKDGIECLMAVERHNPIHLILLDIEMPHLDGFEVCRAIRRVNTEVPIVFVTSHADIENRVEGREAGGDSFMPKPVQPAPLLALVNMLTSMPRRSVMRAPTVPTPGVRI